MVHDRTLITILENQNRLLMIIAREWHNTADIEKRIKKTTEEIEWLESTDLKTD